jgi:formylglycine-generating enzyme
MLFPCPTDASPCDPLDVAYSVGEWVNDWYSGSLPLPVSNPPGPASGTDKALRGGTFIVTWRCVRVADRYY